MSIILLLSLLTLAFGRVEIANLDLPHVLNSYIITYHTNTTHEEAARHWSLIESHGITIKHKYALGSFTGFSAEITDEEVLSALKEDPLVFAIDANGFAYTQQQQPCETLQSATPSWGLARISHEGDVAGGIKNDYRHSGKHDGNGVEVFVIDTGIMTTHHDFQGRAKWGIAYADGGTENDGNGHGTHCAGTVGGRLHGVAKGAILVAVKVLSASGGGTWEDVVAGVTWSCNNGVVGKAVLSMSLGGSGSNAALTGAINSCVDKGIPCVVAAGNSNADACRYTPSGIASAISVCSSEIAGFEPNEFDSRSSFSNWGTCTDIFAPGRDITSTWIGSDTATNMISGTSMACPHVAGYVAGLLAEDSSRRPQEILTLLQSHGQKGLVSNPGTGSPNLLLHNQCHQA
jgi:subtilisin family serine protease